MSTRKGKTQVIVYPDWCKGCGICVAFCPANVLEMGVDGKAKVMREKECINCGFCEMHCPDFAISVLNKTNGTKPLVPRNGAELAEFIKASERAAVSAGTKPASKDKPQPEPKPQASVKPEATKKPESADTKQSGEQPKAS